MMAALTANINRAEKSEPVNYTCFLRYPAADTKLIPGIDADSAGVSLSVVPTQELAENMLSMRDRLAASYIWNSQQWLWK